jgi:phage tail sheath protein FI
MMGLMAKMELARAPFGIAQPPANVPLAAATHTEVELDWGEVAQLSEAHINPLISQAGRGVVAFGARTLSNDPAWIHINSRRVMGLVTEQLRRDNEWAVFETNEPGLWKILERDVLVRLREFWEAGLISGTRALPEYSVRCDAETNPMDLRDAGGLSVEVRMRPVGTTESILVDLRIGD